MPLGSRARQRALLRTFSTSSPADFSCSGKEVLAQDIVRSRCALAFRIHDEIKMARNTAREPAKDLSEQTLDTVSHDRAADLARDREPKPMIAQIIRPSEKDELPCIEPPSCVV